jgi:pimeloyl-ACP methyl ester carboxylesterase
MRTVVNEGITIAYRAEGAGPPVVWLQGLNADHTAWSAQIATFREHYRCIAIDNRDVGRSGRAVAPYRLAALADDVRAVLDAEAVEDAHIVGLSMGGGVAQELALAAPEWVRSLTLVSSFARPDARLVEILDAWRAIYPQLGPADFARQAYPWLFTWRFFERPANLRNLRRYAEDLAHPQEPAAFARQIGASLAHDTRDRLPRLRLPTLVVAGAEDALVPTHLVRELAALIPGARYVELPGVGHSANLEGRTAFNRLLRDFLAERRA